MKQQRKVIHVQLIDPGTYEQHYYFGSIAAIYDTLSKDVIGVTKESLWRALKGVNEYQNKKAIIRQGLIISKETERGIKNKTK